MIDFAVRDTDSQFIRDLILDIQREQEIKKNRNLFISDRKLKAVNYISLEAYWGTLYAIKGQTIFEFATLPCYESIDIRMSDIADFYFKTIVSAHNICLEDLDVFSNPKQFEDFDHMESIDSTKTNNFIEALVKNKFELYVRESES